MSIIQKFLEKMKPQEQSLQFGESDFANVVASYLTGLKHSKKDQQGQDYSDFQISDNRATVAISDGCSGVNNPDNAVLAARLSVEFALDYMQAYQWPDISQEALIDEFVNLLQEKLRNGGDDYEDLMATLTVASFDKLTNKYIVVSIGDGLAFNYDDNYSSQLLVSPSNIEGRANRTYFGNRDDVRKHVQVIIGDAAREGYSGVLICSDGAGSLNNDEDRRKGIANNTKNKHENPLKKTLQDIRDNKTKDDVSIGVLLFSPEKKLSDAYKLGANSDALGGEVNLKDYESVLKANGIPVLYGMMILHYLAQNGKVSLNDLERQGICGKGMVLQTMLPLIKSKLVSYESGFLYISKQS